MKSQMLPYGMEIERVHITWNYYLKLGKMTEYYQNIFWIMRKHMLSVNMFMIFSLEIFRGTKLSVSKKHEQSCGVLSNLILFEYSLVTSFEWKNDPLYMPIILERKNSSIRMVCISFLPFPRKLFWFLFSFIKNTY